jgi:hypothetical protein
MEPVMVNMEARRRPGRPLRHAALAASLLVLIGASTASAAAPARGFLPASARPHGHSLRDLATAWTIWGFGTSDGNPLVDPPRCEQSPMDGRIWFLPVYLGGDTEVICDVPQGAFLLMFGGGGECSDAEPAPWHGGNEAELRACVDAGFDLITHEEMTVDGVTTSNLTGYVLQTRMVTLPADNLMSADPTISMTKGFFAVVAPLSRGSHTLGNYTAFGPPVDFDGGMTYTINVR